MNQDEQKKYVELQIIEQRLGNIQSQLNSLEQQIAEIGLIFDNLDELKTAKNGSEILVPLVNGIFLRANLADTENMLVNVGAGALVSKTGDEVKKLLEGQLSQLNNYRENLIAALQSMFNQATMIEAGLRTEEKK